MSPVFNIKGSAVYFALYSPKRASIKATENSIDVPGPYDVIKFLDFITGAELLHFPSSNLSFIEGYDVT